MGVLATADAASGAVESDHAADRKLPRWFADSHGGIAAALYLIVSLWYGHQVLSHLTTTCACANTDETQWMWSWRWIEYALLHGQNFLLTDRIWYGIGHPFDLAAVTLSPITAIAGIPLSAVLGPVGAYNVMVFLSPVLCGWAAYRLCRYVSGAPAASILAGYTYGFSAYELAHLMSQVNLFLVFVPPMLALVVLRYVNGELSRWRATIYATLLLIIQFGISTEILFDMSYLGAIAFIAGFLFAPAYRGRLIRAGLMLVVAYLVMAAICSYDLYESFKGPVLAEAGFFNDDLLSYAFPTQMFWLGGHRFLPLSSGFATNNGFEQNAYLGLPLCAIVVAFLLGYWRRRATQIIAVPMIVAFVLSLGTLLTIEGHQITKFPYYILQSKPLFKYAYPARLGLFVALAAAVAAALWISWATDRRSRIWRWALGLAAVVFLFPSLGQNEARTTTLSQPRFFTAGLYKRYLRPNEVVLTVPFWQDGDSTLWQADAHMYFKQVGGYFGTALPSYYDGNSLIYQLVNNTTQTAAQYAPELRTFLPQQHVGAVLVQDGWQGPWVQTMAKVGWGLKANVGGIEVFAPGPAA